MSMGKPPSTDQQLEQRIAQLEQRADATDAKLADLEARVAELEYVAQRQR